MSSPTTIIVPNPQPSLAPQRASTTAYAASLVAKAEKGVLFNVRGYNSAATAQFIQIHDAASLPADAAVPVAILTVPATSNFSIDFADLGLRCVNGIVVCNSSTGPTKTIGAADCFITATYA